MSDGSFNMLDEDDNDVEISTFEMDNCLCDLKTDRLIFKTTAGEEVHLPEMVRLTDNTFGIKLPENPIPPKDVELIGRAIEGLDDEDQEEAFAIWVNVTKWRNVTWSKAGDEFREAYAGSYESYADFAKDDIDDNVPEGFRNFLDAEAYGKWSAEQYIVEEGESGTLHFFRNN